MVGTDCAKDLWQEACLIQGTEEASGIGGLLGVEIGGVCGGEEVAKCRAKRHSVSPGLGFLTCSMMSRTRKTPVQSL